MGITSTIYESALVLFKVPLKRGAELHIDTKEGGHMCQDSQYRDNPDFGHVWLMTSLNWEQINNS